ncbi:MAG: glycosyltransferase family 2 protein [Nitrospirota bacterium]
MLNNKKIVVVVPAYNVEKQIKDAVERIDKLVDHIVIVDDCSKDNTKEVIEKIDNKKLIILKNDINKGVGGATITGFKKGLSLDGDIFIKYDGDGQMDPNRMKELILPLLEGYDYAKGNRFIHTNELRQMPKTRLVGNFLLTFLTKLTSGYWHIFDPQNGYLAITRKALETLPLDLLHARYFFENDMLINLNIKDAKVRDVSMPSRYGDEKSSLKIRKILLSFPSLFLIRFIRRIYFKYILYDFSVIGLFYVLGSILLLFGAIFGAYAWTKSILTGIVTTTGTVMISVLPIIIGFQLFLQAIVLEVQESKR